MDFLTSPLGWKNWLLLISALINLGMAIFILSRGVKNKINLYFSLLALSCFGWGTSLFVSLAFFDLTVSKFFFQTSYLSAWFISVFLFYFIFYFPFPTRVIKKIHRNIIIGVSIAISFVVYTKTHILDFGRINNAHEVYVTYFKPFYILYSLLFIAMVCYSLYILWSKYVNIESHFKLGTKLLFITILIGLVVGAYFDLFLDYFDIHSYIWVGPIFTIPMNLVVFYLVAFNRKQ
ncbi:hypothetical protein H6761_02110 [Candidatus Nomurabacteria bacterium]|nr:hypothetical protein [Candidatus Nomurabacteria bacterium]